MAGNIAVFAYRYSNCTSEVGYVHKLYLSTVTYMRSPMMTEAWYDQSWIDPEFTGDYWTTAGCY